MPQQVHYFVALYSGECISNAKIVSASVNPDLIRIAIDKMLPELEHLLETTPVHTAHQKKRIGTLRHARRSAE